MSIRHSPENPAPTAYRCIACKWRQNRWHLPRVGRRDLCKTCYERTLAKCDPSLLAKAAKHAQATRDRNPNRAQRRPRRQAITTDSIPVVVHHDAENPGVNTVIPKGVIVYVCTILKGENPIIELEDRGRCIVPQDSIEILI